MRKLVTVKEIKEIKPIDGADRIELAIIDGWQSIIKKGEFKVGEMVLYAEIDSFLPIKEEYEFLRKSSYKKMGDKEGFRLRTMKLKGTLSQGLILPMSVLPKGEYEIGDDVTEILGVTKYEPPIPAQLSGTVKGRFPSFVKKTNEERIQNFSNEYSEFKNHEFFVTEKLDGTSSTFYFKDGEFGVCSRNLDLKKDKEQTHWKVAIENDLEVKLQELGRNLAIQGEIIGEGIQKNRYGLSGHKLFVFNIFDIDNFEYVSKSEKMELIEKLGLEAVPVVEVETELPETINDILSIAEGKSVLNPKTEREGLVWVSTDSDKRISFKTISNKFLLKGGE